MKIITSIEEAKGIKKPVAIALGNFDGVHRGHQALIRECVKDSREAGWSSCVYLLHPHPSQVLAGKNRIRLINTRKQQHGMIEDLEVDYLFLLPFDRSLAATPPERFVREYLAGIFQVKRVYVGFNYSFGSKGQGSPSLLCQLGEILGFEVRIIPPVVYGDEVVSSTIIREKLTAGKMEEAAELLGYRPFLEGKVITGVQRGRQMGFPTANLQVPENVLLPAFGVYAAWADTGGSVVYPAVVNIGHKPTFGSREPTVEVHLLNYSGNLYGCELKIQLVQLLRPEKTFAGLQELSRQIERDIRQARQILG